MICGAETWALENPDVEKKDENVEVGNRCVGERSCKSEEVRGRALGDCITAIRKEKLRWFGP